uniref:PUM-HD domain-containing protein n=1 Tax=Fagus sylvatica TaxID=28930 RepID=A0A2N9J0U1_FAGSY
MERPNQMKAFLLVLQIFELGHMGFGSSSSNALSQTHAIHETGHNNSQPGPTALYPDSMWTSDYFPRDKYLGAGYYNNYQNNYLDKNLESANSASKGGYTLNLANQNNLVGYNAANVLQGGGGDIMSANSNLFNGALGGLRNQQSGVGIYQNFSTLGLGQGWDFLMLATSKDGSERLLQMLISKDQVIMNNKLIESVNGYQLQQIVAKITSQPELLINAIIKLYGSKSIQRLIKVLDKSPLMISAVISALSRGFDQLMTNQRGSLVIVKCLDVANTQQNKLLYDKALESCLHLAKDEIGCICLNMFITSSKGSGRSQILNVIATHSVYLSQDPSGNFVLQHVLGLDDPVFNEKICSILRGHYIRLSSQKGGSFVVEKCLNSNGMIYVIQDLLSYNRLCHLARNQYGNFVIQAALKATKRMLSPHHEALVATLKGDVATLQSGYGRIVYNLIENGVPLD